MGSLARDACDGARLTFTKTVKKKPRTFEAPVPLAPLADTHAHLTCFWKMDPARALARAAQAGVQALVTLWDPLGDDFASFPAYRAWLDGVLEQGRALAEELSAPLGLFERIRFLAGAHPYGAPEFTERVADQVRAALADHACAGVGEIGLDYHFDADDNIAAAPHDQQIACLERQLELAVEAGAPVELHVRNDAGDEAREAHADVYRVLRARGLPQAGCVLHCFTEDRPTMERFVDLGCYIAFGGASTFKRNEALREAFAACPLDRILFETDCPYMAPDPIRGVECEPAMIGFTVDALTRYRAERTGEDPAQIAQAAWDNAMRLFFAGEDARAIA